MATKLLVTGTIYRNFVNEQIYPYIVIKFQGLGAIYYVCGMCLSRRL